MAHRRLQEEYERLVQTQPRALSAAEREAIVPLAHNVPALWHAPTTTMAERKEIVRKVIKPVIVAGEGRSERLQITIAWIGGGSTAGVIPPSARTYDPSPHISLTPLVAGGRNVGLLVVPARLAPRIPDAPDAVAGCTESDVSGAGMPARGPPTTCPAPVAAAYPAPVRSAASCCPPP